jgi:hypothetical protein
MAVSSSKVQKNYMNLNNTIRRIAEEQARRDSLALPKAKTKREPSSTESNAEYYPQGYYLHFCFHDKTLYEVCSACHRTRKDAKRNLESL